MTSSDSGYRLRIPKHAVRQFEGLLPYGLTDDVLDALERLESDPAAGVLAPDGLRYHVVKVERAPLVLTVIVSYAILEEQRLILVQRVAFDEGDDEAGER